MQRYLMHVSYIGTQFRGVQKIINYNEPYKPDNTTIQGFLEIALRKFRSVNEPHVVPSSRTDTGVHALHSTFHVDLTRPDNKPYNTERITTIVNKYFSKNNLYIKIMKTENVPKSFHCRYNAKSRTYLYRLAILKEQYWQENKNYYHIPIEEHGRCHFVWHPNFDTEKMRAATELFLGLHDFRTFMGRGSHYLDKMTRRNLQQLEMTKGVSSACLEMNIKPNDTECMYNYWNITCKSEGFLYNQVRRIVGALIAVGQGKVTPAELKCMLQVPSHLSWNPRVLPAPSQGLYLCQVQYDPSAFTDQ